jgi:dTDP-4-dehydrorhamnose reductase
LNPHCIIGASGQVGEHLFRAISQAGLPVVGTYHSHSLAGLERLDVTQREDVVSFLNRIKPSVIYLPAAQANVEYCESHAGETYRTNVSGLAHVVQVANQLGAKVVCFSSEAVFDGEAGPYREEHPANPICRYGWQKLLLEHHLALHAKDCLIARTSVVYSWERQGKNFVIRLVRTLRSGCAMKVPVDQIGTPTYAPNLAQVVLDLVTSKASGVYHVAGSKPANRYEFALEAARVFGLDPRLILPVSTQELGQIAPRPLNAGMCIEKAAAKSRIPLVDYRAGLRMMATERQLSP